jgi:hypothetical protein
MERRSADDAQAREIANPLSEDNGEGREARADVDPRSLSGRYLPRLVVSAAALILIVVKLVRPGAHIDAVVLGLLALAAIPWLSDVIQSAKVGGFSIEFKVDRLERRQDRQRLLQEEQGKEIRQLRFLVSNFANPAEVTHLTKLASSDPFPVIKDGTFSYFKEELHRLRGLQLIEGQQGKGLRSMEFEGGDVKDHFKITDKGKEFLRLLAEVQTDEGK